jgi:hypothetical protein
MWPLDQIKPYPNNPRRHPQTQIDLLAKLIKTYGPDQPIVVDDDGIILKGHGRRLAALAAGMKEFPVYVHKGLSEGDKHGIRIADNRIALLSGWDDALLKDEIANLQTLDFDMSLLGFSDSDFVNFFAAQGQDEPEKLRTLTQEEQIDLNMAWKRTVKDWVQILDGFKAGGFLSSQFTKGALAVHFMRARLYGFDIPRAATLPYTGNRLFVNGDKAGSISDFLHIDFDVMPGKTPSLESIAWFCGNKISLDKFLSGSLAFVSYRQPAEFPADLARKLVNEFVTVKGGRVLDPCHGWGGRALGFLLSDHAAHYHGFEVDQRTLDGVQLMVDDLKGFCASKKSVELELRPYEDAKLKRESFDFALTSPPYYNVEKYDGEQTSWRRYGSFDDWVKGFFAPLITKTMAALKPGGVFALQVGNQSYPLEDNARRIAQTCGAAVEKRTTEMINNINATDPVDDGEIVLIMRKVGAKAVAKLKAEPVEIKVSAKMARIAFTECGPTCIAQNGCKGNCCISASKPGGCFVTVHPDEQQRVEAAGAVVRDGMIVPSPGTRGCPFHVGGLCALFNKPARPFGCIASPFTLNRKGTMIVRNRYTVLPCHLGPGAKQPAYKTFRTSLVLLLGEQETVRLTQHFDNGGGDCSATMPRATYDKLMVNDDIKRSAKAKIQTQKTPLRSTRRGVE